MAKTWKIKWKDSARKELRKLDNAAQKKILRYLRERLMTAEDPRRYAKPLRHALASLWRYRIGDYRIICAFREEELVVLVLRLGHRKDVYDASIEDD